MDTEAAFVKVVLINFYGYSSGLQFVSINDAPLSTDGNGEKKTGISESGFPKKMEYQVIQRSFKGCSTFKLDVKYVIK